MADEKRLKARVAHKHKTEAEWYLDVYTAANSTTERTDPFIPLDGELIIFDPDPNDPNNTKKRFKFGDGVTNVIALKFIEELQDVTELPTTDINPNYIYRLLTANMVMDRTIQTNATCYIVTELGASGEPFITYRGPNDYLTTGYYNKTEDKLYCYIDQSTKNALSTIIDESSLSDLEKLAAKGAILLLGSGWKNTEDILKTISTIRDDIAYGGTITSLNEAIGNNVLYVYLTSELYQYVSGKWVLSNDMKSRIVALENRCTSFHVQGTTPNLPAFNLDTTSGEITFLNPCFYVYNNKFGSISKGTVVSGATAGNSLALVENEEGVLVFKSLANIQGTDIVIFNALRWASNGYYNPDCISIDSPYQVNGVAVGVDAEQNKAIQMLQNRCASFHVQGAMPNLPAFKLNTTTGEIIFLNQCYYVYNNTYKIIAIGTRVAGALDSNSQALVYDNTIPTLTFKHFFDITDSDIVVFYTMRWGTNSSTGNSNQGYYNPDCISIKSAYQVDDKIIGKIVYAEEFSTAIDAIEQELNDLDQDSKAHEDAIKFLQNQCVDLQVNSTSKNAPAFNLDTSTGAITFLNECYYFNNNKYVSISKDTTVKNATSGNILALVAASDGTLSFKTITKNPAEKILSTDTVIFYTSRWKGKGYVNPSSISITCPYTIDGKLYQAYNEAERTIYVDPDGDDSLPGDVPAKAWKSISKAIQSGATHIALAPGTYYENIKVSTLNKLHIYTHWEEASGAKKSPREKAHINASKGASYPAFTANNIRELILESIVFEEAVPGPQINSEGQEVIINPPCCTTTKCTNIIVRDCEFYNAAANGLSCDHSNGQIIDCVANNNGIDGFNFHGSGSTTVINCIANYNGDDGISHHEAHIGSIIGGEFAYNKKGGIASPTYGAKIDIHNAYLHDNDYGVFAQCPASYNNYKVSDIIKIYNCTVKRNKKAGVLAEGYNIYAYSCLFEGNKQEHSLANDGAFTAENCTRRDQRLSVVATNATINRLKFDMTELKALGITTLKNLFSDGQSCAVFTKVGLVELTINRTGDEQIIFNEPITGIAVGDILVTSVPDNIEATKVVAKEVYANNIINSTDVKSIRVLYLGAGEEPDTTTFEDGVLTIVIGGE